jgi:hypothetical protein
MYQPKKKSWHQCLTKIILELHKNIWEKRNHHVHGKTIQESRRKAREAVLAKVTELYAKPPRLAPRYQSIYNIPLKQRLCRSTDQLNDWLNRIEHQRHVTEVLHSTLPPGQLTLKQAYLKKGYSTQRNVEYPP